MNATRFGTDQSAVNRICIDTQVTLDPARQWIVDQVWIRSWNGLATDALVSELKHILHPWR